MQTLIDTWALFEDARLTLAMASGSGFLLFIGLKLRSMRRKDWIEATEVMLRVVAVHTEGEGRAAYRSEFEIVGGPHDGRRHRSDLTSNPAIHTAGQTVSGWMSLQTGEFESQKVLKTARTLEFAMFGLAATIGGITLIMAIT